MKKFLATGLVVLATTCTAQAQADDLATDVLIGLLGAAAIVTLVQELDRPYLDYPRRDYYDYRDDYPRPRSYGYQQRDDGFDDYRDDYRHEPRRYNRHYRDYDY